MTKLSSLARAAMAVGILAIPGLIGGVHPVSLAAPGTIGIEPRGALPAEVSRARPLQGLWPEPPSLGGGWVTWANGDDILVLAAETDRGVLWAGTRYGGLVRWDVSGDYVQYLRPQQPLAGNRVNDILITPDGAKWFATDRGISVLDDKGTPALADDEWWSHTSASSGGALPSDDIRALATDGTGIWVGTAQVPNPVEGTWSGGGLVRLETQGTADSSDDTWSETHTFASTQIRDPLGERTYGLVSDSIHDLLLMPGGNLWVATDRHWLLDEGGGPGGLDVWIQVHGGFSHLATQNTADTADDVWTAYSCETPLRDIEGRPLVACTVRDLAPDADGRVWAAVGGLGAIAFPGDRAQLVGRTITRFDRDDGLEGGVVEAIHPGPDEDTVWFALRDDGLRRLMHGPRLDDKFDDEWTIFNGDNGVSRRRVQALLVDPVGAWLGTGPHRGVGGGIDRLQHSSGIVEATLITAAPHGNSPPSNFITAFAFGQPNRAWDGQVWIGTGSREEREVGSGIALLDPHGSFTPLDDSWTVTTTLETDDNGRFPYTGLAGDNIHALLVDGDRLWVGSAEGDYDGDRSRYLDGGLSVFTEGQWTARNLDNTGGELREASISALALGCDGRLWIGSGNAWANGVGIDVLAVGESAHDIGEDTWGHYSFPNLASTRTTDIRADCENQRMWVGGHHHAYQGAFSDGGIARFDLDAGEWLRFDTRNGLTSFAKGLVYGETTAVELGPNGEVYAGAFGTLALTEEELIRTAPYWPLSINRWEPEGGWSVVVFDSLGWASSMTRDVTGRLWVGAGRGGVTRNSLSDPDLWPSDPGMPGLLLRRPDGEWYALGVAQGIPGPEVSVVGTGTDGTVWVGTEGYGLAMYSDTVPEPDTPTPSPTPPSPTATPTASVSATPSPTSGTESTPTPSATPSPTLATASPSTTPPTATASQTATPTSTRTPESPTPSPSQSPCSCQIWLPAAFRP